MNAFPNFPQSAIGTITLIGTVEPAGFPRMITLQYSLDSLSRTLQFQVVGGRVVDVPRRCASKGLPWSLSISTTPSIDASGLTGEEAEALKATCKAAMKVKPSEKK